MRLVMSFVLIALFVAVLVYVLAVGSERFAWIIAAVFRPIAL